MRKRSLLLSCIAAGVFIGGCSEPAERPDDSTPQAPSEVTGVIVDIDSAGLGDVRSFELKRRDQTFQIFIDPEVDYGFDVGHLSEHLAGGDPVTVGIDEREGRLIAEFIDDA